MAREPSDRGNQGSSSSGRSLGSVCEDPNFDLRYRPGLVGVRNFTSVGENRRGITGTAETSMTYRRRGCPPIGRKFKKEERMDKRQLKSKIQFREKKGDLESDQEDEEEWNATILSWLIKAQVIQEDARVIYIDQQIEERLIKEGIVKRDGILCCCCQKVFTIGSFEVHAVKKMKKPYENIFIFGTSVSLFSCMLQAWNKPAERKWREFNHITNNESVGDSYDDACVICADGGNLMCCDACTSTYHHTCMNMQEVPEGKWYCPYCACKFCGKPGYKNDNLLSCPQCEKKYHWHCYQKREKREQTVFNLNCTPTAPFCEKSCREIKDAPDKQVYVFGLVRTVDIERKRMFNQNTYRGFVKVHEKLERNIGVRNELSDGFAWTWLQCIDEDSPSDVDFYRRVECHSKLAIACKIMNASFEPIKDRHTKVDMVRSVVYNCGSNFNRVNFQKFYSVVLEKNEEIISVASLRIHGTMLAEMPFIATTEIHRQKGMCSLLMSGIESALRDLKVENLVIPSTPEMVDNWIKRYGFDFLRGKLQREMVFMNTLMFHDSIRLRKYLPLPAGSAIQTGFNDQGNEVENRNREDISSPIIRDIPQPVESLLDLNLEPP